MARSTRSSVWAKRVERWKDSGLTSAEYAAETGINAKTLLYWSCRLNKESRQETKPSPAPRKKPKPSKKPKPAMAPTQAIAGAVPFIEVVQQRSLADDRLEIKLRSGHRLFVPASFQVDVLSRVLEALEARP